MVDFISKVAITRCCAMCCREMPVTFCGEGHSIVTEALSMMVERTLICLIKMGRSSGCIPVEEKKGGNARVILCRYPMSGYDNGNGGTKVSESCCETDRQHMQRMVIKLCNSTQGKGC